MIVRVKPLAGEQSALIVYAYFWDNSQFAAEMRLWMARSESGWKLFDWEQIPFGTAPVIRSGGPYPAQL